LKVFSRANRSFLSLIHFSQKESNNNVDLSLRKKKRKRKKIVAQTYRSQQHNIMSSSDLRELFEACKTGDLVKVKKLLTPQNVNEIGEFSCMSDAQGSFHGWWYVSRHGWSSINIIAFRQRLRKESESRIKRKVCELCPFIGLSLYSASFGHSEVVSILLDAGASPNACDNWNYTLLHESVSKGKIDVCLALLQHGANTELRNSENKTPLDLADANRKPILTGEYRKDELLEAARLGDEKRLLDC
jgi:tankyrase